MERRRKKKRKRLGKGMKRRYDKGEERKILKIEEKKKEKDGIQLVRKREMGNNVEMLGKKRKNNCGTEEER